MKEQPDVEHAHNGMIHEAAASKRYRRAFFVTLLTTIVLAIGVAALWRRLHATETAGSGRATAPAAMVTGRMAQPAIERMLDEQSAAPPQSETALAPMQLSPQRMQSIGVQIGKVKYQSVDDEIRFYGNVQADERRLAYVQTRFAGWIRKLYADATGDFVRKGQPLFTIYSPDLVTTEQEYLIARKNQADLQQSSVTGVASGAASLFSATRDRLLQWEISPSEIAKLDTTGKVITDLTINSPASGYITEKNVLPNMYVQPEIHLFTVSDLSDVWVLAQVFQNDAGKIKPGDRAEVAVDAYPGRVFTGRVDYLLPQMDTATRTLPIRLVIPNPGLKLRPGMYVNVRLKLPLGKQLVVPGSAVFHSGTRDLVFTYRANGLIEPREVGLGSRVGEQQIVAKGVHADEQIVISANFLIDSEAQLLAAAGAFVPPPPGAGAAAAMNVPAQDQATVELATDPSPPHKGSNTVRVKVTSSDGKPVNGAQVTVTFFMAAMQEMGMAAMKTVVNASDKGGGGLYEGTGDLGSGGTWQVTVAATRNGQVIVSKHLTLNATGGM
jgi:Cu(I)/Ag(I) efflux system membrane fusion protein/cobalt-zinc-cadmium efflux system membrane fusion protein